MHYKPPVPRWCEETARRGCAAGREEPGMERNDDAGRRGDQEALGSDINQ